MLASQLCRWLSQQVLDEYALCTYVSAIYPNQHKREVIPTKKHSKIKMSTCTFWLSIFELTDLSGMLSSTLAVLRLVHSPWQDMYELFNNYRESNLRFSTIACMHMYTYGCSFTCSQILLFLGPSYSFISVIVTRYTMWSVWLSPADGVGGKGCKEHGYAFPPQESGRTVLPWPWSVFSLHSLLSPSCEADVFGQTHLVKWKSP